MDRCMLCIEFNQTDMFVREIRSAGNIALQSKSDLQAILNYQRKSTIGWSIHNILLVKHIARIGLIIQDFFGGLFSLAQLFLDAVLADDASGISGNLAKFGLSMLAMSFDVLFMFQHYILYRDRKEPAEESEPILA